jgi:hypothetical protein
MRQKILPFLIFISLFFLNSCTKISEDEIISAEKLISPPTIEKIKQWYYAIANGSLNSSARGINNLDWRSSEPQWEKTKSFTSEGKYVTPVGYYATNLNTDKFLYKFLITSENSDGAITTGQYIMLFVEKNVLLSEEFIVSESLISPDFLTMNVYPAGFSGEIARYNLDYTFSSSEIVDSSIFTDPNRAVKLVYSVEGVKYEIQENAVQRMELACGECVEWYEEIYNPETGHIYSSTYLYTECGECNEGGGSGGGLEGGGSGGGPGTGNTPTNPCPVAPFGYNVMDRVPVGPGIPSDPNDPCGPVELEDDEDITCPNNFIFVSVTTNSLWQEAKLINVYSNLVKLSLFGGGITVVEIP